jgi:predicted amidophosphoribosyltransferase
MVGGVILLEAALDLLLPSVCPLCREAPGPGLCRSCATDLPALGACCPLCGAPAKTDEPRCTACCDDGLSNLDAVLTAYAYRSRMRQLIGDAKAGARAAAVSALAPLLPLPITPVDAIVPVPPSPGRRPGPHLATACARLAARRLGVPCLPLLTCTRHASEQHTLSRAERARNVVGLFTCHGRPPARVLLVDDILTSGATASAAASVLRAAGAKHITAAFLARTP